MRTKLDLAGYIEEVIGQAPVLHDLAAGELGSVPLFLRSAYRLVALDLFGCRFIVAIEEETAEGATPAEYARQVETLRAALGTPVVLGLRPIPTHARNRLVQQRVPFIVPGRQLFLPFLAVDLREREPLLHRPSQKVLSDAAQAVLLGHLLGKSVEGIPLRDVASEAGYSAMTLSKVADELEAKGLAIAARAGKQRTLRFGGPRRELWDRSLPAMASPVRSRLYVKRGPSWPTAFTIAGLTALERYTSIMDDSVPTFAVWRNELRRAITTGEIIICKIADDADALVEGWAYAPARLGTGDFVDRLSLYLSLRESPDERVQKELRTLLEGMGW